MWGKCREAVCAREVRGVDSGVCGHAERVRVMETGVRASGRAEQGGEEAGRGWAVPAGGC